MVISRRLLTMRLCRKQIDERPDRSVISTLMLRSMQQAVYQPKNEGHFGLALSQYAHFTSPIRRYPDLLVHRAIKHVLKRDSIINYQYSPERMNALGESCSTTERRAEEATRDVVSWLKCEFMQDHIGAEYPGVITAVTSFGLFIELTDIHVEGLLHVTNLSHDYYRFEQAAQAMVGERTGKQYRLGDPIMVRVDAVNLEDRKIDFAELGTKSKSDGKSKSGKDSHSGKASKGADDYGSKDRKRKKHKKGKKPKHEDNVVAISDSAVESKSESKRVNKVEQSKTEKKTAAKKTAAKKTATKKTATKKTTAKKTATKKTATKKTTAKKATAKKVQRRRPQRRRPQRRRPQRRRPQRRRPQRRRPQPRRLQRRRLQRRRPQQRKLQRKKLQRKKLQQRKPQQKRLQRRSRLLAKRNGRQKRREPIKFGWLCEK